MGKLAKKAIEFDEKNFLDDGCGGVCSKTCPTCGLKTMFINRPEDFRCSFCDDYIVAKAYEIAEESIFISTMDDISVLKNNVAMTSIDKIQEVVKMYASELKKNT